MDRSSKFLRAMTGQSATTLQQMTPKVWKGQVMPMAETFASALCPLNVRLAAKKNKPGVGFQKDRVYNSLPGEWMNTELDNIHMPAFF